MCVAQKDRELITGDITKLLQKQAVMGVEKVKGQFVSQLFLVPKKDGSQRLIVNLKPLNHFIGKQHFKMEGAHMLKDLLRKGDWMVSIDLKDAYQLVPIAENHRKFLRFVWEDQLYEFQCLPFGLSSAPRTFTKILKPVMAVLRQRGVRSVVFIDDILLMAQSQEELVQVAQELLQLLQMLGFSINCEKSVLIPSQLIIFLVDSVAMSLSLPEEKLQSIITDCRRVLRQETVSVRDLARVIGRMTAAIQATIPAPLCNRNLQRLKNSAFQTTQSFETRVQLVQAAREELSWWIREVRHWNGKPISLAVPDMTIETDASLLGWGACTKEWLQGSVEGRGEKAPYQLVGAERWCLCSKSIGQRQDQYPHKAQDRQHHCNCFYKPLGRDNIPNIANCACKLWQWCLKR